MVEKAKHMYAVNSRPQPTLHYNDPQNEQSLSSATRGMGNSERWDWTMRRLLREAHPHVRLREAVRNHPLFESVTLGALLENRLAVDSFLSECRRLPHCGETQINRLRQVIVAELDASQQRSINALPLRGVFHKNSVAALEDVYLPMWRLAQFAPFVYVPSSIPEIAKTAAVLAAELAGREDIEAYVEKLSLVRRNLGSLRTATGWIFLDSHTLETILKRQGRYSCLSLEDAQQQRCALEEMAADLPAGIKCVVTDFEAAALSSSSVVGDLVVLYSMGGYSVFRNPAMVEQMRFRHEAARAVGRSLTDFLQMVDQPAA